jgi:hypothetical protein
MPNDLEAILARLIDVWMPHLSATELRAVLLLIRRGHYGDAGFPRRDQAQLCPVLQIKRGRLYQIWDRLLAVGLLLEGWEQPGFVTLRLNREWVPPEDLEAVSDCRWRR